jgi:two-component system sensor histidine kinase/response regulator
VQSADELLAAVNDVLDLSKLAAGELSIDSVDFDLRDLIEETVRPLTADASRKNIQLDVAISSKVPRDLKGDADRLRQIIRKQLSRVIEGGHQPLVKLRVECVGSYGATITLRFSVADPAAVPEAEEAGPPQREEASIADYRGLTDQDETELDLAVCNRLVKFMGGEVGLHGPRERHTPFWFALSFRLAQ